MINKTKLILRIKIRGVEVLIKNYIVNIVDVLVESGRVLERVDRAEGALEPQLEVVNILDMSPERVDGGEILNAKRTMLTIWIENKEQFYVTSFGVMFTKHILLQKTALCGPCMLLTTERLYS